MTEFLFYATYVLVLAIWTGTYFVVIREALRLSS